MQNYAQKWESKDEQVGLRDGYFSESERVHRRVSNNINLTIEHAGEHCELQRRAAAAIQSW